MIAFDQGISTHMYVVVQIRMSLQVFFENEKQLKKLLGMDPTRNKSCVGSLVVRKNERDIKNFLFEVLFDG